MARRNPRKQAPEPSAEQISSGRPGVSSPQAAEHPPARASGRRWAGRLALLVLAPSVILGTLEAGLRIADFGYPTGFFAEMDKNGALSGNEKFIWQFYSSKNVSRPDLFLMPAKKPSGSIRIFVLGESAAMGTPEPAFSVGRILEVMLQRHYPNRRFEVLNAAMRGINSHVILPIARDCARHEPDLFLVYAGNNEVIGLHCPTPGSWLLAQNLALLRCTQWIKSTRVGQCFRLLAEGSLRPSDAGAHEMEYFRQRRLAADDKRRQAVDDNFRANLDDVCQVAIQAGAKVILSTVAVNLKDSPPFGSLHRPDLSAESRKLWEDAYAQATKAEAEGRKGEAVQNYQAAARIDDHFAELHFRLARSAQESSAWPDAQRHFTLARDWDALQFRADSRINALIRQVASARRGSGVNLVDAERALAESDGSDHGTPGERLFHEHVHPTFDGVYLLARAMYPAVAAALGERLGPASQGTSEMPSRQECADALAFTGWDEIKAASTTKDLTARPPFTDQVDHLQRQTALELAVKTRAAGFREREIQQAIETYRLAIQQRPDDWRLRFNLGNFYQTIGQHARAVEQFQFVVNLFPRFQPLRLMLGKALAQAGHWDAALSQFEEAIRIDAKNANAQEVMAWARKQRQAQGTNALIKNPVAPPFPGGLP